MSPIERLFVSIFKLKISFNFFMLDYTQKMYRLFKKL